MYFEDWMYINIEGKPEWNIPKVGKKKKNQTCFKNNLFSLKKKKIWETWNRFSSLSVHDSAAIIVKTWVFSFWIKIHISHNPVFDSHQSKTEDIYFAILLQCTIPHSLLVTLHLIKIIFLKYFLNPCKITTLHGNQLHSLAALCIL